MAGLFKKKILLETMMVIRTLTLFLEEIGLSPVEGLVVYLIYKVEKTSQDFFHQRGINLDGFKQLLSSRSRRFTQVAVLKFTAITAINMSPYNHLYMGGLCSNPYKWPKITG